MTKLNLNDDTLLARAGGKYEDGASQQQQRDRSHQGEMEGMTKGFEGRGGRKHQMVSGQHLVNSGMIGQRIVEHAVASVRANKSVHEHDENSTGVQTQSMGAAENTGASVSRINFGGGA